MRYKAKGHQGGGAFPCQGAYVTGRGAKTFCAPCKNCTLTTRAGPGAHHVELPLSSSVSLKDLFSLFPVTQGIYITQFLSADGRIRRGEFGDVQRVQGLLMRSLCGGEKRPHSTGQEPRLADPCVLREAVLWFCALLLSLMLHPLFPHQLGFIPQCDAAHPVVNISGLHSAQTSIQICSEPL